MAQNGSLVRLRRPGGVGERRFETRDLGFCRAQVASGLPSVVQRSAWPYQTAVLCHFRPEKWLRLPRSAFVGPI